jgi:Kdo2-lipid IVA lauroyltransferase/acyltransferase
MRGAHALRPRHYIEYAALRAWLALCGSLSLERASAFGGWLGRRIGPHLPVSQVARRNLALAMPELSPAAMEAIVRDMWDNLGRVAAEYAHLERLAAGGLADILEFVGYEHFLELRDDRRGGFMFGAHLGNWELAPLISALHGLPLAVIYRAPNNPLVERFMRTIRGLSGGESLPKGGVDARRLVGIIRKGGHIAMLLDQKMNDGIPVPFFGREAMTAPALVELALRSGCPVFPARVERLAGARFRVTVYPRLDLPRSGDRQRDVREGLTLINRIIEGWVRERPAQWFWVHQRWPKAAAAGRAATPKEARPA